MDILIWLGEVEVAVDLGVNYNLGDRVSGYWDRWGLLSHQGGSVTLWG